MSNSKNLISIEDYSRIYNITTEVLGNVDADINHACLFYALVGKGILENHFGIHADVEAGAAIYLVDPDQKSIIAFADIVADKVNSTEDRFHAWLRSENTILDFMAPGFGAILEEMGEAATFAPKMFQKDLPLMKKSIRSLNERGDFLLYPNHDLTVRLMEYMNSTIAFQDIIDICNYWFAKYPGKIQKNISIRDTAKGIITMEYNDIMYSEAW